MKLIGLLGLMLLAAGCGPAYVVGPVGAPVQMQYDPCAPQYWNSIYCDQALAIGGYSYGGIWYHYSVMHPRSYYQSQVTIYQGHGGVVRSAPNASAYKYPGPSGVARGGSWKGIILAPTPPGSVTRGVSRAATPQAQGSATRGSSALATSPAPPTNSRFNVSKPSAPAPSSSRSSGVTRGSRR